MSVPRRTALASDPALPGGQDPETDEHLFLDGRDSAMTRLIGRYERPLYRFLLRATGDAHQAEDLFQETFLRLQRARASFQPGLPLRPYLYRIALNLVRDARARDGSRPATVSLEAAARDASGASNGPTSWHEVLPGSASDPSADAERGELRRRVRQAVEALPDVEREVVILRVFEGLSFAEIASATGVPLPTAKSRLLYALRRLRPVLETA